MLANTLVKPGKSGVRGLLVLLLVCADKEVEVLDAVGGRGGVFLEKRDLEKGLPLQKPIPSDAKESKTSDKHATGSTNKSEQSGSQEKKEEKAPQKELCGV